MSALSVRVRGTVQGVGFRPFVFRLARSHGLTGWVKNAADGVHIHAEGADGALASFARELGTIAPLAARVDSVETVGADPLGCADFQIADSDRRDAITAMMSPDLPVCAACLHELFDGADRRAGYPYINCTECGPRYSIILALPYDRPATTMRTWDMCACCAAEYEDRADRRFHAQPVACPECGPHYSLHLDGRADDLGDVAIRAAAALLRDGRILAIKSLGGYHLACDAGNAATVHALRERKFRKEKPFAVMVRDLAVARKTIQLDSESEALLLSAARPIVVAGASVGLDGVAPETSELGVMLPYTPLHHLLFAYGAPDRLVMTSANRASEPIAFRDADALCRLSGIADAFLVGHRPIARRVDDSVVRVGGAGTAMLRRSRGYAPGPVARLPATRPILALGGDLKNTITLVVGGEAVMSQHVGDLEHLGALEAFRETVADLTSMYGIESDDLCVAHDLHPQYASTACAQALPCRERFAIQHHRAHVASVVAERGMFDERVIGVAFDGTGYGDDGSIWGGEFFAGSVREGFERVAHLRTAMLPGGDAAARFPVQAAAGFLDQMGVESTGDLRAAPFGFPERYERARQLLRGGVRSFATTSAGRLFDAVAALLGFTREITFEGQAAIWLEQLASSARAASPLPVPFEEGELDFRPALMALLVARRRGRPAAEIARAFHLGLARGIADAVVELGDRHGVRTAVLSGGVFQNHLLLRDVMTFLSAHPMHLWLNRAVPANDGGISLGQAALAMHRGAS